MRIATWNVNSLRARLPRVSWWLERAQPDVLLMQETKLADADAPVATFHDAGYELAHYGQGRWNGVASRREKHPNEYARRERRCTGGAHEGCVYGAACERRRQ